MKDGMRQACEKSFAKFEINRKGMIRKCFGEGKSENEIVRILAKMDRDARDAAIQSTIDWGLGTVR